MLRWLIQKIKAMLLCIEYGILFVDTVNTKIKACNALNAMFIETVNTTVKTHPHIPAHNFLNIQWIFNPQKVLESWDWGLFNHTINTIYVDTVDTRQGSLMHSMLYMSTLSIQNTSTHSAHNFLNIQRIFNPQKVLESWDSGLFNHTINTIYVNTVDTVFAPHSTLYKVLCKSHKHQCQQCWQT